MTEEKIKCPKCGAECETTEKFCGECGTVIVTDETEKKQIERNKKYEIKKKNTFVAPVIIDYVGYIIGACVFAAVACFALLMFSQGVSSNFDSDSSVFQQIYNLTTNVGMTLGIGVGACIGITLAFVLSALSRFTAIQKQINDTQELIHKHLDIVNERFNTLEDKK